MESMRQQSHGPRAALVAVDLGLAVYLTVLVLLSVDVLVRIFVVRALFGSRADVAALLLIEGARALTIALTLALAVAARLNGHPASGSRGFALLLGFLGIAYAKAMTFEGFPGFAQERIALGLFGMGVPRALTDFVFGSPQWAVWLALGAFLRLAATVPAPVDATAVERSGAHDRQGMMRSVALAGADVGAGFRSAAAAALRHQWLRPAVVWPVVAAAGVLHSTIAVPPVHVLLTTIMAAAGSIAITIARAGYGTAGEDARRRMLWIVQAAVLALAAFLVSAVFSIRSTALSSLVSLTVATVAPFAVLAALHNAIAAGVRDARSTVRRTIVICAIAAICATAYQLLLATLSTLALPGERPLDIAALIGTAALATLFRPRLSDIALRAVPDPPQA